MRALEEGLRAGAADLSLSLDQLQIRRLLDYLGLIEKWNRVYNLTAVRNPADMLTHHLLDSLAVIAPLRNRLADLVADRQKPGENASGMSGLRLLDVGTGAGLPGVVIAICLPEIWVDCVDTVAKKAAFIRQAAATLGLPNLRALHARVESVTDRYQVITSRAFASLTDFTRGSSGALAERGVWLAMKGRAPADEIAGLPAGVTVIHVEQLAVPGLDAERCIVWMRQDPKVLASLPRKDLP